MRCVTCPSVFLATLLSVSVPAFSATIPIFGTGVDNSGQFLPAGAADPHYVLIQSPVGGPSAFAPIGADQSIATAEAVPVDWPLAAGFWVPDSTAQWISPVMDAAALPGINLDTFYTYETQFDLTGFDLSTVQITGHWTADNWLSQVALNGTPIYSSSGCGSPGSFTFASTTPFSISSGLQAGVNTLDFSVVNSTCVNIPPHPNPTGLLVDVSAVGVPVPEPNSLFGAVFGLALMVSIWLLRRKLHA